MKRASERVIFGSDFPIFSCRTSIYNVKEYIHCIEENEKTIQAKLSAKCFKSPRNLSSEDTDHENGELRQGKSS